MADIASGVRKSVKHAIIDKANSTIVIAVAVAVFVVIFSLFAGRALISQSLYHGRVISEKQEALKIARTNRATAEDLKVKYQSFATEAVNILQGNPTGDGPRDGDNAKIVLDALPSEYDFPALSSSIEKILLEGGYQIESVGGSEEKGKQNSSSSTGSSSRKSQPVQIPYPLTIETSPDSIIKFLETLEKSIRPFKIVSLDISGKSDSLEASIEMVTYFQPTTGLSISSKEVK